MIPVYNKEYEERVFDVSYVNKVVSLNIRSIIKYEWNYKNYNIVTRVSVILIDIIAFIGRPALTLPYFIIKFFIKTIVEICKNFSKVITLYKDRCKKYVYNKSFYNKSSYNMLSEFLIKACFCTISFFIFILLSSLRIVLELSAWLFITLPGSIIIYLILYILSYQSLIKSI